jgi:hypothetical protein
MRMLFPISRYRRWSVRYRAVTRAGYSCLSWLPWFLRLGRLCRFSVIHSLLSPLCAQRRIVLGCVSTNGDLTILLLNRFCSPRPRAYTRTCRAGRSTLTVCCSRCSWICPWFTGRSFWPISHHFLHKKGQALSSLPDAWTGGTPPALQLPRQFQSPKHLPLAWTCHTYTHYSVLFIRSTCFTRNVF